MIPTDDKRGIRYSDSEAPKIEFPCEYPIKVMGDASDSFQSEVLDIVRRHAPAVQHEHVRAKPSAKGNYVALTIVIEATGLEQLELIFADLKGLPAVRLVL
jgi:uncharacterized protein